jgi:D-alanine-D-alanine ligase
MSPPVNGGVRPPVAIKKYVKRYVVSRLRVAVLMGGTSAERAISLSTGRQIMAALDPAKYEVLALDSAAISGAKPSALPPGVAVNALKSASPDQPGTELAPLTLSDIAPEGGSARPDVVFIALHGKGGEDGTVQGMLEFLGLPYTGSGVLASALAMDKAMTKQYFRGFGIPVPQDIVLWRGNRPPTATIQAEIEARLGYPVIVKPNAQGSTIGCAVVREAGQIDAAVEDALQYDPTVLIEQFITGTEITVGLLGNEEPEVLPIIEIEAKSGFYDYEAKYAPGGSAHIIPARLSPLAEERARDYAARCHRALGCRGMSRVDMMVVDDQPYVLEVNTIPGMTPTSLLPEAAKAAGIEFSDLLDRLIRYAMEARS